MQSYVRNPGKFSLSTEITAKMAEIVLKGQGLVRYKFFSVQTKGHKIKIVDRYNRAKITTGIGLKQAKLSAKYEPKW